MGKIIEKDVLMMKTFIGSAEMSGKSYELSTSMNGAPMVQSNQTGRWFALTWDDIIKMALEAGIDKEKE